MALTMRMTGATGGLHSPPGFDPPPGGENHVGGRKGRPRPKGINMRLQLTDAEQRLRKMLLASEAADEFAECLVSHEDCCELRDEALRILELVGITELDYLQMWAQGLYNA